MKKTEYRTKRRELRRQLRPAYPSIESQFKQVFALGQYHDEISAAKAALNRLNGVPLSSVPTQRQFDIACRVKVLAKRQAQLEALRALREAGADEAEINAARWRMEDYNMDPANYLRRAAELKALQA